MMGPKCRHRTAAGASRRWPRPAHRAAAGLAAVAAAALAIPALTVTALTVTALTVTGGAAMAATSAGPAAAGVPAAGTATASVQAWGRNAFGALGDGTTTSRDTPVRVKLPKGTKVTQVRAGCVHTLALTSRGRVLAWGLNAQGQLGDGSTVSSDVPVKVKIPAGITITAVRAGCLHSLALTSKGQVLAWGANSRGELGDGSTVNSDLPVKVKLPRHTRVTAISAGAYFSLASTAGRRALAWGENIAGQLGDGTTVDSHRPVKVKLPLRAKVTALAGGGRHTLALTSAGLFSWGSSIDGQLGNGTPGARDTPAKVKLPRHGQGLGHVTSLFAGCDHSLALFSRGTLLAWGDNTFGQLGTPTVTSSSDTPVKVKLPHGSRVRAVTASCADSFALTATGRVLAWGDNGTGILGNGTFTPGSPIPVRVDLPAGWRASALGAGPDADHALALAHKVH